MSAPLVGREEELQALELFLATTRREPRALVIEGEAGVGKTSLWEAAIHTAADGGARCLSARPAEAEASFAYAALGDLLRGEGETLATLPPRQRHAVEVALLPVTNKARHPTPRASGWACSASWSGSRPKAPSFSRWTTSSGSTRRRPPR
jgi:hypothetical protein